ncbi:hypothetical protein OROHE_017870 [Orobanche hederae]
MKEIIEACDFQGNSGHDITDRLSSYSEEDQFDSKEESDLETSYDSEEESDLESYSDDKVQPIAVEGAPRARLGRKARFAELWKKVIRVRLVSQRRLRKNYVVLEIPGNKNNLICNFCKVVTKGGIRRAKEHTVGGFRNNKICKQCPPNVREEIAKYMQETQKVNLARVTNPIFEDVDPLDHEQHEYEEDEMVVSSGASVASKKKRQTVRGPMDLFARRSVDPSKVEKKDRQTRWSKDKVKDKVVESFTRWLYDGGIPFNTVKLDSLQEAFDDIGAYGVGCRKPSYHEARVSYLQKAINHMTLLNFLVNSPKGSVFIESIYASNYAKIGEKVFQLINAFVERVGKENVVQITTDNASNMVSAGKLLEARRPHLYWTPCAANYVDLMLEDIGEVPAFKRTFKKGMKVTSYVYNRPGLVTMLRSFTGKRELSRVGVTRFATCFLNLERLHVWKDKLRSMFTSEAWFNSKWSKEVESKSVTSIILSTNF